MLSRINRIVSADDYRSVVRSGRRSYSPAVLVYIRASAQSAAPRFGFIVAKSVGNAVNRNLVRRRMKSIASDLLPGLPAGTDIVFRALPGAAQASWDTLTTEITTVVAKGMTRA